MKTIVPIETFSAYVGKTYQTFEAGQAVEVADDLAANAVEKGLAREKVAEAPKPIAKPADKETAK